MRLLISLTLLFFVFNLEAQKPSYKSFYVYYSTLPCLALNPEVKTFTVHYHSALLSDSDMDYLIKHELNFQQLERVEENGDLQIHFDYPNPVVISKSGSSVKVLPSVLIYVEESSTNKILYYDLVNGKPISLTTERTGFPIGADLAKVNNKSIYKRNVAYEFLGKTNGDIYGSIHTFEKLYFAMTNPVKLTFMGGKGSYDYSELDASFDALKEARALIKEGKLEEYKQVVNDQKTIWEKWLEEENTSDKKAKVSKDVADGLKLSVAHSNFMLGRADIAMKMTEQLIDRSYSSRARAWALNARMEYSKVESEAKAASINNFSLMDYHELNQQSKSDVPEGASPAMEALYKFNAINVKLNNENQNSEAPGLLGAWKAEDEQYYYEYFFLSNYKIFTIETEKEDKRNVSIRKQFWMESTKDGKQYLLIRDFDARFRESATSPELNYDMLLRLVKHDKKSVELINENSKKSLQLTR